MTRTRVTAASIVAVLAFAAALTGIWDPDFFHHLAVGRAIARGTSFAEDPFLFTLQGSPGSPPSYWLGSLLIYLSSVPAGLLGPQLLVALLTALLCTILLFDAIEERSSWRAVWVGATFVLLALPELRVRSAPRPEAFGVLLVAWTLFAIRRFELGRPRLLLTFPVVALLWSQIHVSVAIGLGLLALQIAWLLTLAAGARFGQAGSAGASLRAVRTPALVFGAALLAAALNPSSTSPLRLAVDFLSSLLGSGASTGSGSVVGIVNVLRDVVEELRAPSLSDWTRPFGALVAAALASFALHRSRHWGRELATVLAFAFFASTSYRFTAIASVAAAPIAARNLLAWLDSVQVARPRQARTFAALAVALGLARAVSAPTLPLQRLTLTLDASWFPVRAAEYLRAIGFDGRLYNAFAAGGYLEWILDRKVFQDGRGLSRAADMADLFPEPVDGARMARLDARWGFDALVISTEPMPGADAALAARVAAVRATAADPAIWSLVALDDGGALYLRRAGRWAAVAARDEYRLLEPGGSVRAEWLYSPDTVRALTVEFQRLVRESPRCTQCRVSLTGLLLEAGRTPEASPILDALDRERDGRFRAHIETLKAMRAAQQNR
jgi:hypothetical protein